VLLRDSPSWRRAIRPKKNPDHNTLCDAFDVVGQLEHLGKVLDLLADAVAEAGLAAVGHQSADHRLLLLREPFGSKAPRGSQRAFFPSYFSLNLGAPIGRVPRRFAAARMSAATTAPGRTGSA
jgi:hypothetical protein